MPRHEWTNFVSKHLGNHRRPSDVLQVLSFPGLSVDNVPSTPSGVLSGVLGQVSAGASGDTGQQVADLSKQLNDLKTTQQSQLDKLNENTQALRQNTAAKSGTGASPSGGLGSVASGLLSSTLGLSPIFQGLIDLFGGSNKTVQPLVPFNLPPAIQYAGALNSANGGVTPVDYGQNGAARPLGQQSGSNTAQASPTVQIQVNALDTQSFLDHSDDIARAVRQALLNSSSLNDVIADL